MPKPQEDNDREERIMMEIVVDAHDSEERAMGWYYYLEYTLQFPFSSKCKLRRQISPLKIGDAVEVIGMADEKECQREMFVKIQWDEDALAVPLAQLDPVEEENEDTIQAIEDYQSIERKRDPRTNL